MYRFYLAAMDLLPGALLLLPVYLLLHKVYFRSIRKSILYYLFSCYLSVVYVLVGLPNITYIRPALNLNLIPILGIAADLKNSLLNILLFIPLGIALPAMWNKYKTQKNTLCFGFGMSLAIELAQILTYRATDINDLITNTLGSLIGFLFAKALLHIFPAAKHFANHTQGTELTAVLSIVILVMFFIYPFVSAALWDLLLA